MTTRSDPCGVELQALEYRSIARRFRDWAEFRASMMSCTINALVEEEPVTVNKIGNGCTGFRCACKYIAPVKIEKRRSWQTAPDLSARLYLSGAVHHYVI